MIRSLPAATAAAVLAMLPAAPPPPVDDTLLPPRAAPAPPVPTRQQEACAAPTLDPHRDPTTTQLKGVDLHRVWRLTRGAGQKVAVIDTGVARHPRLRKVTPGGDYVSIGDGTQDCDGHGTLVAGIIAATPDPTGRDTFSGVAPDAAIISIRQSSNKFEPVRPQVDSAGATPGFGDVETLAMAVRTAADLGATVINISSVACTPGDAPPDDRSLGAALAYAVDVKDAVVVASAGNVGTTGGCPKQNPTSDPAHPGQPNWVDVPVLSSPGWYDDYVLAVGSATPDGSPSVFSLAGPWVDVAAVGEAVVSLDPRSDGLVNAFPSGSGAPAPVSGTSFAAPVVSGLAALVRARFPELTARQVTRRITATAHHPSAGWDPVVGNGLVDVLAAVSDLPPTPASEKPSRAQDHVDVPEHVSRPDDHARRTAITGVSACVATLAAALALAAPANRLARRRHPRPPRQRDRTVVGD